MSTNGDYIRPLFPGLTLPDATTVGLQRAIPVGPVGGMVRDALSHVFPSATFADDDWVTVTWNDTQNLGQAIANPGIVDDPFDGSSLSSAWSVLSGTPIISGGRLRFRNTFPQGQIRSTTTASLLNKTFTMYGLQWPIGSAGDSYKARGVLLQSVRRPGTDFMQLAKIGSSLITRTSPGIAAAFTFDAVAHANLRMRCTGTQVFFEGSANGTAWTAINQMALPAWAAQNDVFAMVYGGCSSQPVADPNTESSFDRVRWA